MAAAPCISLDLQKIILSAPGELIHQGILTSALRRVRGCVVCAGGVCAGRELQHKQQVSYDSALRLCG